MVWAAPLESAMTYGNVAYNASQWHYLILIFIFNYVFRAVSAKSCSFPLVCWMYSQKVRILSGFNCICTNYSRAAGSCAFALFSTSPIDIGVN